MIKKSLTLVLLLACSLSASVLAETIRIEDIRIDGLQRVSAKTIFAVLPIKINTDVSTLEMQDAVREIFKTGFFAKIDIVAEENILVLKVTERPAVNRIAVAGNSIIDTEALLDGLKNIDTVEHISQYLLPDYV